MKNEEKITNQKKKKLHILEMKIQILGIPTAPSN